MEFTRQAHRLVFLAGGLTLLAILLTSPVLLVGAGGVGAWVLGRQWQFIRATTSVADEMAVEQSLARKHVTTDEAATVTLRVNCESTSPLSVAVKAQPPIATTGATVDRQTVELSPGTDHGEAVFSVMAPTAGQHQFGPATVTMTDPDGLFRTTLSTGTEPTLTVEPRQPDDVHVGEGGEEIGAFGSFSTDQFGEGIDPAELRAYTPGDPADRIDWKSTARLGEPHVIEFEVDTDRRTVLIIDHRSSLGTGPEGEQKLDYLRQVALALIGVARQRNQAIGLVTVDDDGITARFRPATGEKHYANLTRTLFDLNVTGGESPSSRPSKMRTHARSPAAAKEVAGLLEADESPYGQTLYPYFADAEPYVRRIAQRPLYETVRTEATRLQGTLVTMLLTDDNQPDEIREAVKTGSRGDSHVAAFVTPSILFEQSGLADLDSAYDRYADFERFRRELAGQPRVEAYEVAPEARIDALLAARRRGDIQ